jgi:hypothetical protein
MLITITQYFKTCHVIIIGPISWATTQRPLTQRRPSPCGLQSRRQELLRTEDFAASLSKKNSPSDLQSVSPVQSVLPHRMAMPCLL